MKNPKRNQLEGIFHLDEGAGDPVDDVTELHFKVNDERVGCARHELPDATWLTPGQSTRALLTFVRPDPTLPSLDVGCELDAYRGTRKIGTLHITEVSRQPFAGSGTEPSEQTRLEPQSSSWIGDTVFISFVYLIFAVPTVYMAVNAYAPCQSNFEGGCSMGRGLMAMASLVPAAVASLIGVLVKRQIDKFPALALRIASAHSVFWAGPLIYILVTFHALFR